MDSMSETTCPPFFWVFRSRSFVIKTSAWLGEKLKKRARIRVDDCIVVKWEYLLRCHGEGRRNATVP